MTVTEISSFIGATTFPISLVIGLLWFGKRDFWPWFTKYMADRAVCSDKRHQNYTDALSRNAAASEALVGLITRIDQRLDEHTHRLGVIESAVTAAALA